MAYANQGDRNDYNIASSQAAQGNFDAVAKQLEDLLSLRQSQINALMGIYQADGVSEKYQQLEANWNRAGTALRAIIAGLRKSLAQNDDVASQALSKAAAAVHR
ncbi:MAG: hypothetical protein ACK5KO_11730 [Arachnia sp.]